MVRFGEVHDRLVAVLLELALAERSHNSGHLALCHTRRHRPMGYKASGCAPTAARRSVQEPVRLELGGDLLDGLLDVRRFAGPRADDLAAAEHQEDDLRLVDAIDEARELLRFVFDGTGPEGDRDRVEVERGAEVRRGDDVLDLDLRVLLDRDACGLDLLRDEVDRRLHVLEALRAGADDLPAAEEEDRGLRLLDPIDESGELLRLVLGAAQGEGDRLEVELAPEGGRCDDVLDPVLGHGEPPRSACTPSRSDDTGHNWWLICFGATATLGRPDRTWANGSQPRVCRTCQSPTKTAYRFLGLAPPWTQTSRGNGQLTRSPRSCPTSSSGARTGSSTSSGSSWACRRRPATSGSSWSPPSPLWGRSRSRW